MAPGITRKLVLLLLVIALSAGAITAYFALTAPPGGLIPVLVDVSDSSREDRAAVMACAEATARYAVERGAEMHVALISGPAQTARWEPVDTRLGLWERMQTSVVPEFEADKIAEVMGQVRAAMATEEPPPSASDVLSATATAARHIASLRPDPGERDDVLLVVCSDGSTVSRHLDVYRDDLGPEAVRTALEQDREEDGLADLTGVEVYFPAAGRDPNLADERTPQVHRLWTVEWRTATNAKRVRWDSVPAFGPAA
jgi:hypothetical protein